MTGVAEQVIEVPKIALQDGNRCPSAAAGGTVGGSAGRLFSFVGQVVDIPVLGSRGFPDYGGLQGFFPEQSPSAQHSVEQNVDIPVPGAQGFLLGQGSTAFRGSGGRGGHQGLLPGQSSTAFGGAARRGGHQGFHPEQGSTACGGADVSRLRVEEEEVQARLEAEQVALLAIGPELLSPQQMDRLTEVLRALVEIGRRRIQFHCRVGKHELVC